MNSLVLTPANRPRVAHTALVGNVSGYQLITGIGEVLEECRAAHPADLYVIENDFWSDGKLSKVIELGRQDDQPRFMIADANNKPLYVEEDGMYSSIRIVLVSDVKWNEEVNSENIIAVRLAKAISEKLSGSH